MHFFTQLQRGQRYLESWLLDPKLGGIFPENRVIKSTKFAQKFMPFVAVFAIVWQQIYAKGDTMALAAAVLTAIFALCIPLQGLYWLGKRANSPLPVTTQHWFKQICSELEKLGENPPHFTGDPTYQQLALILRQAKQKLPAEFWQEL